MFTKSPITEKLAKKSADCHNIFTKTSNDLHEINLTIDSEIEKKNLEIQALLAEQSSLSDTRKSNKKVIDNISKIFE